MIPEYGAITHDISVTRAMAVLTTMYLLVVFSGPALGLPSEKAALVNDEDDTSYDMGKSLSDDNTCTGGAVCTSLSNCFLLQDLMDQSCLVSEKLGSITCGYQGNEVKVCCPQGGMQSPFISHDEELSSSVNEEFSCGQPILNDKRKGGGPGGLGSQPWVVRVGYINVKTGQMTYPCCGSIISKKTILTAAHCALAKASGYQLASVRIGEYDGKGDPDCTKTFCAHPVQDIPISHVIVHPGFERKTFKHDVAMLVLNTSVNYSVAALPICLLTNPNIPLIGRRASLVGWGKTPGQEVTPTRQQLLELPIISQEKCNNVYSRVIPVTSNQICVGGEKGMDACSGFGGAPLILLDHYTRSRYYQVGIASFGSDKCGTAGVPSVYSSTQRYSEWIRNNMV